jgi:hypothetical protein
MQRRAQDVRPISGLTLGLRTEREASCSSARGQDGMAALILSRRQNGCSTYQIHQGQWILR